MKTCYKAPCNSLLFCFKPIAFVRPVEYNARSVDMF